MKFALPVLLFVAAPAAAQPRAIENAPSRAAAPPTFRPLRAAFVSSSAFGVTHDRFFNQLLGARLDYRFTPRLAFGGSISYANLKGKDGRVSNLLPEALLEWRLPLDAERLGLPLHWGLGFLPKNGPTLRVGAGLDFAFSDAVSLEILPLEPMIWVNRDRPEVSLDASIALRAAF